MEVVQYVVAMLSVYGRKWKEEGWSYKLAGRGVGGTREIGFTHGWEMGGWPLKQLGDGRLRPLPSPATLR